MPRHRQQHAARGPQRDGARPAHKARDTHAHTFRLPALHSFPRS